MLNLLIYIITMSITPGPNTILSMANAAAVGLKKGVKLNIGMLIGITIVTTIAFIAAEVLYSVIPKAKRAMKIIAFAYLLYLAFKMLKKSNISEEEKSASFTEGLLLQLVNVKVYLLAITAITAYIMPMTESLLLEVILALLIPIICFIAGLIWAAGGSLLKNIYSKHSRIISIIFSLSLVWCAARIFI